jgi:hypothetical protein
MRTGIGARLQESINKWLIQRNVPTRCAAARQPKTQNIAALTARVLPTKLKSHANAATRNAAATHNQAYRNGHSRPRIKDRKWPFSF